MNSGVAKYTDFVLDKLDIHQFCSERLVPPMFMGNANSCTGNQPFIENSLKKWLDTGAIEVVPFERRNELICNSLTVAESPGKKPRLCLNSHFVNLKTEKSELDLTLPTITDLACLVNSDSVMAKLDCKSGFLQILLQEDSMYLFGFKYDEIYYCFRVMPWGYTGATFIFQKMQECLCKYLEHNGICVINYIDDMALISTERKFNMDFLFILHLFRALGFYLSKDKVEWYPLKSMVFLGIGLNVELDLFYMTDEKLNKLSCLVNWLLVKPRVLVRDVQKVLGYLAHLKLPMNFHGALAPALQKETRKKQKKASCQILFKDQNTEIHLSPDSRFELLFWREAVLPRRWLTLSRKPVAVLNTVLYLNENEVVKICIADFGDTEVSPATLQFLAVRDRTPLEVVTHVLNDVVHVLNLEVHIPTTCEELLTVTLKYAKERVSALNLSIRELEFDLNCSVKFVNYDYHNEFKVIHTVADFIRARINAITRDKIAVDLWADPATVWQVKGKAVPFYNIIDSEGSIGTNAFTLWEIPSWSFCFPQYGDQDTFVRWLLQKKLVNFCLIFSTRGLKPSWVPLVYRLGTHRLQIAKVGETGAIISFKKLKTGTVKSKMAWDFAHKANYYFVILNN